ncbi:hypothetical protein MKW98_020135, partial [Papaver atlanticum]
FDFRFGSLKSIMSDINGVTSSVQRKWACSSSSRSISARKFPFPKDNCSFYTADRLICVMDLIKYCLCINTIESTTWIEPTFIKNQQEKDKKQERHMYFSLSRFGLGYDPVTKKHKVIAVWCIKTKELGIAIYELGCEVLTVRHNTWRKIEVLDVPTFSENLISITDMWNMF